MNNKDILYSIVFNNYRNNIINLDYINMTEEEYYKALLNNNEKEYDFISFCLLRNYLSKTEPVKSYKEILDIININNKELRLKYQRIFPDNYLNKVLNHEVKEKLLKEDNKYLYFDSKTIYGKSKKISKINNVEYIIRVNEGNKEIIAIDFLEACKRYRVPYLFEIAKNNDSLIIKSDKEHLSIYNLILREINIHTFIIKEINQDNNRIESIKIIKK